ncbi:hypothetical protein QIS74_02548, partial [Colletotrichum tabaci]
AWVTAADGVLEDPHTCELPPDGTPPIQQVPLLDGYGCTRCPFRTSSRKLAKLHAQRDVHEAGLPAVTPTAAHTDSPGWGAVQVQSLCRGRYTRYWIVQARGIGGLSAWQDSDDVFAERLSRQESLMAAEDEEWGRTIVASLDINQQSSWVREMGWAVHLAGLDLIDLHAAGQAPVSEAVRRAAWDEGFKEEQRRFALLSESFRREVARCSLRLGKVPLETKRWLKSIDPSKPHGRPFELGQEADTVRKYQGIWERYLCYCIRAHRLGRTEARRQRGVRFTDEQWTALDALADAYEASSDGSDSDIEGAGYQRHRSPGQSGGRPGETDSSTGFQNTIGDRPEYSEALDPRVYRFCVVSLKQKVAVDIFANPLLHFTAILGILDPNRRGVPDDTAGRGSSGGGSSSGNSTGPEPGKAVARGVSGLGWCPASKFTQRLAGIMWGGRILMLEHFFEAEPIDGDPNEISVAVIEDFVEQFRYWLADGSHTPFSAIIRMMAYGKGHRRREGGRPRVMWEASGRALRYLGQRVMIEAFQKAARTTLTTAEATMEELMRGGWAEAREALTLDRVVDTALFEGAGQSFATNEANSWLRPGPQRLAELCRGSLWDARLEKWRQDGVLGWLAKAESLKRSLLASMHVWGGQPGRGPEMTTARYCDTQDMARNVFVFDGQVMIVTDRDKNQAIRGLSRKVARFLPDRLGKMMVAYIAWVLPFERLLYAEAGIHGPSRSLHPWLWKDARRGVWGTAELSKELDAVTRGTIGVSLTVSSYRHVAIELGRKIRGLVVRQVEVEIAEEDDGAGPGAGAHRGALETDPLTGEARRKPRMEFIWDLQATHGGVTARRHYAMNIEFPNQLQPEMVANFREISRLWHAFLESTSSVSMPAGETTAEGQQGPAAEAEGQRQQQQQQQQQQHRRQQPTPTTAPGTPAPKRRATGLAETSETPGSRGAESGRKRRAANDAMLEWRRVPDEDELERRLEIGLHGLFGEGARWKTAEQHESARQVMSLQGGKVLMVVLPTGAGKSALFMLPAVPGVHGGVSIVVVPFVALLSSLTRSARRAGLDFLLWQPASVTGRVERVRVAPLVFVGAEYANCAEFASYAEGLRARGLLKRIFVDECHTVLTDAAYRPQLLGLRGLHRYDRPVILLTATLPVRMEGWFRRLMVADEASIVRASTARPNIRYRVTCCSGQGPGPGGFSSIEAAVLSKVRQTERVMGQGQKGVVYCRSKQKCERLAAEIGCSFYHGSVSADGREEALEAWSSGRSPSRWMAATTGLGSGVDIQSIVAVLHAEAPYGLVDFVQQTGRGGRAEGETVDSVVFLDGEGGTPYDRQASDVRQLDRQGMERFLQTEGCRRVALGVFMDGYGQDCTGLGGEVCDRCEEQGYGELAEGWEEEVGVGEDEGGDVRREVNRLAREEMATQKLSGALRGWLDEVEGKCAVCYMHWCNRGRPASKAEVFRHRGVECGRLDRERFRRWRAKIQFEPYACCWRCGLGQTLCPGGQGDGAAGGSDGCRWADAVLPVIQWTTQFSVGRRWMQEEFEVDASDEAGFTSWLGRSRQV